MGGHGVSNVDACASENIVALCDVDDGLVRSKSSANLNDKVRLKIGEDKDSGARKLSVITDNLDESTSYQLKYQLATSGDYAEMWRDIVEHNGIMERVPNYKYTPEEVRFPAIAWLTDPNNWYQKPGTDEYIEAQTPFGNLLRK